mmetsp:Transcript_92281/g.187836  ORF Transcript_92281/g.187836 Transcript_92281/m.187836 type:complete len:81 (+) Transcript_92281:117-359(+)
MLASTAVAKNRNNQAKSCFYFNRRKQRLLEKDEIRCADNFKYATVNPTALVIQKSTHNNKPISKAVRVQSFFHYSTIIRS